MSIVSTKSELTVEVVSKSSKFAPLVEVIELSIVPLSLYTSELSGNTTGAESAVSAPTGIVTTVPSASVTTSGLSVTGLSSVTVYTIVPLSSVIADAVSVNVVVSILSTITVVLGSTGISTLSKPPPEVEDIVALSVSSASLYTSLSGWIAKSTLPVRLPAGIVITAPFERFIVISEVVGLFSVAV